MITYISASFVIARPARIAVKIAAVCLTTALIARAAEPGRTNVLFIVMDDLRPELGCYGKDYIRSPNIDALAARGLVFDRAYCQQSVCSPSRTSVMTGVRPDTSKVVDNVTSFRVSLPDVVTLGQHFKNNGYFVQGMGKIYHGGLDDPQTWSVPWRTPKAPTYASPQNAGITGSSTPQADPDDNHGADPSSYKVPESGTKKQKDKKAGAAGSSGSVDVVNSRGPIYECADVPDNTYTDGKVADLAVRTLGELSKAGRPFFLAVGFVKPHLPWVAPKKYYDLYDPAEIALAPNPFLPKGAPPYAISVNDGEPRSYKGIPAKGHVPDDLARKFRQAYFAGVSYSDAQVGRVLAELDRLHLRDNTIVVLWGDHGWKLGEHDAWGKHTNVENDCNAPLILSVPGMKNAGTHSRALVELVDIYPTLCECAGLPLPSHLEGLSMKPLLDHPGLPWKTAAFSQFPRGSMPGEGPLMGYTMRTDRYRLTVWVAKNHPQKIDAIELYDDEVDPQENTNIAKRPDMAATVGTLMARWKAGWRGAKPPAE